MKKINKVQQLQFDLMKYATFNNFDGEKVVNDLIKHSNLWKGCIMGRPDLIQLRDIEDEEWNVDELYILTTKVNDKKLESLAKKWDADEIDYLDFIEAGRKLGTSDPEGNLLRIWWD